MNRSVSIKDFEKARDHMEELVHQTMVNLEIGIYDPWLKYLFEQGIRDTIRQQFKLDYPDISVDFNFSIILSATSKDNDPVF